MAEEYPVFEVDLPLLKEIVNYLTTKPYVEVFQFVQRLQALKQISGPKPEALFKPPPRRGSGSDKFEQD